jgi:hypothetical protein
MCMWIHHLELQPPNEPQQVVALSGSLVLSRISMWPYLIVGTSRKDIEETYELVDDLRNQVKDLTKQNNQFKAKVSMTTRVLKDTLGAKHSIIAHRCITSEHCMKPRHENVHPMITYHLESTP